MSCARFTVIVVLALAATVTFADTSVRTETSMGKDAEIKLEAMLAPDYAPLASVHVDRSISRLRTLKRTHWRRWQRVQGCALTIAAEDFPKLIGSLGHSATHRAATAVKSSTPVPPVGTPFPISEVYFISPPEAWHRNDPLIYTNSTRTRVLVYAHYLVEE